MRYDEIRQDVDCACDKLLSGRNRLREFRHKPERLTMLDASIADIRNALDVLEVLSERIDAEGAEPRDTPSSG